MQAQKAVTERLRYIRQSLNLTQAEMAARLGYRSYRSWQEFESGNRTPTFDVLEMLSHEGFRIDWILTGEGPMLRREEASSLDMVLLIEAIKDVKEEMALQGVSLSADKEADIIAEVYTDALLQNTGNGEINRDNVVRFVRFSK